MTIESVLEALRHLFELLDYLMVKLFVLILAVIGVVAVIKEHLKTRL